MAALRGSLGHMPRWLVAGAALCAIAIVGRTAQAAELDSLSAGFAAFAGVTNGTFPALGDIRTTLLRALEDPKPVADPLQAQELAHILSVVNWKNGLVLWVLPQAVRDSLPLLVQSWIATAVFTYSEYFLSCILWSKWIYSWYPNKQIEGKHPDWESMKKQMFVSMKSIPLYSVLPPLSEHMILLGWTRCYGRVATVGFTTYLCNIALFMMSVEFGVYWQHRKLHEVKWAYKWLHATHHVYNKEHTLSPFAGLAFNPLDGIMQAVPYVWTMFLVPMHYLTLQILLFCTGVWTANIHDCIDGRCEPIMGAAYHAIHHITYKHNYGHYTTLFDGIFGTLSRPDDFNEARKKN